MDTVQVYFTDLESYPPVRDVYWKDCEFTMMNPFLTEEDIVNPKFPHDGSDHYFVIKIMKLIPTARSRLIQEREPNRQHPFHKDNTKMIQLSNIRELCSYSPSVLTFQIEQRRIHYRIEFSSDEKLKWLIGCIMNEIHCFTWDQQLTNLRERRYVVQNEILWKKYYKPIELPRHCRHQIDDDDDDEVTFDIHQPKSMKTIESKQPLNMQQIIESWGAAVKSSKSLLPSSSSHSSAFNVNDNDDDKKEADKNFEYSNMDNVVDHFWCEEDMDDVEFDDDDDFFYDNESEVSAPETFIDDDTDEDENPFFNETDDDKTIVNGDHSDNDYDMKSLIDEELNRHIVDPYLSPSVEHTFQLMCTGFLFMMFYHLAYLAAFYTGGDTELD